MNNFSSELDHILNNHDAAKRFSKNKLSLFKLYDYRGKEHYNGTLSWSFTMAGLGLILLWLHEITGLPVFRFLMFLLLIASFVLMLRIIRAMCNLGSDYVSVTSTFMVDIINKCKKMDARKDQIQMLQKAAQDQDTPATWWGWVETAIQQAENWSSQEIKNSNKNAVERVSQKKIQVWRQKEKKKAIRKVN